MSLPGQSAINDAKLQTNMDFLFNILINAGVIFILASFVPAIKVKSYLSAVWVFLLIGLLNATVGFFLRLPINLLTLYLLCFFVRILVSAVIIKLAARLHPGFEVSSWRAAFLLAVCLALVSFFIDQNL